MINYSFRGTFSKSNKPAVVFFFKKQYISLKFHYFLCTYIIEISSFAKFQIVLPMYFMTTMLLIKHELVYKGNYDLLVNKLNLLGQISPFPLFSFTEKTITL